MKKITGIICGLFVVIIYLSFNSCKHENQNPCENNFSILNVKKTGSITGKRTGTINVSAVGGTGIKYSINDSSFSDTGQFLNLPPKDYTITAKNSSGCISTLGVTIEALPDPCAGVTILITITKTDAFTGQSNGSITASATGSTGLSYSKDGVNYQSSGTFSGLAAGTYTITAKNPNGCSATTQVVIGSVDPCQGINIQVSGTVTNPNTGQSNGSIVANATGSTGLNYSKDGVNFQASGTFTGLAAGTYTITAKNANGCTGTKTFTLTGVSLCAGVTITVTGTTTNPTTGQSNGSITASATGSTGLNYSKDGVNFQASGTFTGLPAGTYTITAKNANGCTGTNTFTLTGTSLCAGVTITVTGTSTNPSAGQSNGSITATATGSTGLNYSKDGVNYQPSGTFTGLAAGTYTITAKNSNGCTGSAQFTLLNPCTGVTIIVTGTTTNPTTAQPAGGVINASASGSTGLSYSKDGVNYQPSGTFTGLAAGSYTITSKNANGCSGTHQFTLVNGCTLKNISVSPAITNVLPCASPANNGSISVTGSGSTATPFFYSFDNGSTYTSNNTAANLAVGGYTIVIKDQDGCTGSATATVGTQVEGPLFSAVMNLINSQCTSCHYATSGLTDFTMACNIVTDWSNIQTYTTTTDPSTVMPPSGPLSATDIKKITDWVNAGHTYNK